MDRLQLRGWSGATLCRSGGASHLLQLDLHVSPLPCCGPDSLPCRHLPILCTTHHRRRQPRRAHRSPVCGRPHCAAARAVSTGAGAHERPCRRGHGSRPGEAQLRGRLERLLLQMKRGGSWVDEHWTLGGGYWWMGNAACLSSMRRLMLKPQHDRSRPFMLSLRRCGWLCPASEGGTTPSALTRLHPRGPNWSSWCEPYAAGGPQNTATPLPAS